MVLRYLLGLAIWAGLFAFNYRLAEHSILPIADSLWLPNLMVPATLFLMYLGFLAVGLTIKPPTALFDTRATVEMPAPRTLLALRMLFGAAMIVSGYSAWAGRERPEFSYSTHSWGIFWMAMGAWTLLTAARGLRRKIEISPRGVTHPQIRPPMVRWEDVAEVKSRRWIFSRFVIVKFRDGADYRLSSLLWRWRKLKQITFLPFYFGIDAETLANALSMRRDTQAF
jgi:hypothetical protein